ncbi:hypothetical protein ZIOFF_055360 [Zingiber officinale]|uniref:DNA polymerase n=1 Tax=Zingiber officinale TaxID=94328 RepID=A0A8J5FGA7_ZINOF|nr:hypothetical protein ZIOFF_055360 [Zingiber officinale]
MEEPKVAGLRTRGRGSDASVRSAALERLKALRSSGGRRSDAGAALQVKMEAPIYDVVEEDDYAALVASRREKASGFIVDDDGLGYADDGQEEDWSNPNLVYSSGDEEEPSGGEEEQPKRRKAPKMDPALKKPPPSSLTAAAAMMGKQRLSSMFTSSIFKKNDRVKGSSMSSESIVDDVIAEFAPDETDREKRRRNAVNNVAPTTITTLPVVQIKAEMQQPLAINSHNVEFNPSDEEPLVKSEECQANDDKGQVKDVDMETHGKDLASMAVPASNESLNEANNEANLHAKMEDPKRSSLNATIKVENDGSMISATADWRAVCHEGGVGPEGEVTETKANFDSDDKFEFTLEADGSLPFYIIDAHEETSGGNSGILYLFGKVKAGSGYHSCCIIVKNMQRCVYAIPKDSVFDSINIAGRNSPKSQMSEATLGETLQVNLFILVSQDMASEMKNEVAQHLLDINVSTFSMMPVKRNYAFERLDIPSGEQYVLKINYPFKDPPLPADLRGKKFLALLGTHTRLFYNCKVISIVILQFLGVVYHQKEDQGAFMVVNFQIYDMSSWSTGVPSFPFLMFIQCVSVLIKINLMQQVTIIFALKQVSWCKLEIIVDCPKDIRISTSKTLLDPPVVVTAINLKTVINEKNNENEIVTASVVCCHKAKIDGPMVPSEWKNRGALTHFSIVRKLEGGIFPMGMTKEVSERNSRAGTSTLALESSERALLNRLMIELNKLDSDVLVGHNISGFDLDVLLRRAQVCKVPSATWSKIGRLKRYSMPKLTKGSGFYGSGATPGIMSCIAGRLLCDTYLCSRDLLREVSYSLTQLAKTQLNKDRKEISPHDIPSMFQSTTMLLELASSPQASSVEYGETDAWLSLELMFHLSVLPLTRQLTNISGNLWGKTLQGARAQRVEYLLLHAFHAKKYITPDKISSRTKELNTTKRKSINCQDGDEDGATKDHESIDIDAHHIDQSKGKKGPAYAGGLVLEPKKGLYDKLILLLDFNSLYPSIIQEYNICFTTVERSPEGLIPNLPSSKIPGVLPEVSPLCSEETSVVWNHKEAEELMKWLWFRGVLLRDLVERRRMVKSWLKTASRLKIQQLDIQQQALKLTANSMYGCLGFSNSRFYAKPLAELITLQGREILQSTVDLVQNNLNLEVIYGDTDSIMIYSGLDDINKARAIAGKVIQEVNKKYRRLEIDLDGLYKRMLLLKKKKYAAVKVLFKDGMPYEVIERKGLDMVQEDMRNGEVALEKYVITKTLTKPPEDYPDAKNQPHVQVALRLKKNGHTGCSAGDTVPYIICCQQENFSSSTGIAQRARHPDELKRDGGWMIDIDYYLSQQIHPVVSRLCASIQGTSPARLADCLGLDSAKFQFKEPESVGQDPSSVLSAIIDIEERFRGCEPLRLSCSSCSSTFDCPPISSLLSSIHKKPSDSQAEEQSDPNFWQRMRCPRCPDHIEGCKFSPAMLANQVKRQADNFIYLYYKGLMMCDDEICKYTTRSVNLRVIGDSERGTVCPNYPHCNGHLIRQYTEKDLYKQLSYFCHVLDASNFAEKLDQNVKLSIEKELAAIRPAVSLAESVIQKIRDRCSYGWVQLKDLCISV